MDTNDSPGKLAGIKSGYELFCGLLLLLAVTISILEIVARVFFRTSFDFVIDLSVWLTIWSLLFMAGPLLAENGHVSIDFIRERLDGKLRLAVEVFIALSSLSFGGLIAWGGILFVKRLYTSGGVFPRYFPIPMWIVEICVPIGMLIFTGFALVCLVRVLRHKW